MDEARKQFSTPLACPTCGKSMKHHLDEKCGQFIKHALTALQMQNI